MRVHYAFHAGDKAGGAFACRTAARAERAKLSGGARSRRYGIITQTAA
jgi:hypothetical protein